MFNAPSIQTLHGRSHEVCAEVDGGGFKAARRHDAHALGGCGVVVLANDGADPLQLPSQVDVVGAIAHAGRDHTLPDQVVGACQADDGLGRSSDGVEGCRVVGVAQERGYILNGRPQWGQP